MKKIEMVSQFRPSTRPPKPPRQRDLPKVFDQQKRVEEIYWFFDDADGPGFGGCGRWFRPVISHPYTRLPVVHPGMTTRYEG